MTAVGAHVAPIRVPEFDSGSKGLSSIPESGISYEGSLTLPFASLSQALGDVPEEPEWIWNGFVATGAITLIGGKPKAGKATAVFG